MYDTYLGRHVRVLSKAVRYVKFGHWTVSRVRYFPLDLPKKTFWGIFWCEKQIKINKFVLLACLLLEYFAELGQNVAKLDERCNKLGADNGELEAAVDRLRTALSQMEQMKKDLQHKASLLTQSSSVVFCCTAGF